MLLGSPLRAASGPLRRASTGRDRGDPRALGGFCLLPADPDDHPMNLALVRAEVGARASQPPPKITWSGIAHYRP
jgi:hypothetical protein